MNKLSDEDIGICIRLKEVRVSQGLKQGLFAQEVKTTQGHISDIENFRKPVSQRIQEIICLKYKVNKEWLQYGTGGPENMYIKPEINPLIAKASALLGKKDPVFEAFIETYYSLSPSNKELLLEIGMNFFKNLHDRSK